MNKRLLQLFAVLCYDTDSCNSTGTKYLTLGQRICINQERAYIMQNELTTDIQSDYEQPETVEDKIKYILNKIKENELTRAYAQHAREHIAN